MSNFGRQNRLLPEASAKLVQAKRMLAGTLLLGLTMQGIFVGGLPPVIAAEKAYAAEGIYKPMNYQGKVEDSTGVAMADGQYNMKFKIFAASSGGNALWTETWDSSTTRVTMTGGLFSLALGTHVTMTGSVDFNSDSLFLQIEFDPGNDDTYEETFSPRRRFASVPYAHNADMLDGLHASQFIRSDQDSTASGTITIKNSGVGLKVTGTASGNIVRADTELRSSGSLVVDGTTTLKSYASCSIITTDSAGNLGCGTADIQTQAEADARYVNIGGDTMTGALNVLATISGTILHARDQLRSSGTLLVDGASTLNGALTLGSTLTIGGVTYTFPTSDGSASGKVLATDSAGQLSWTAQTTDTDTTYSAGQGLALNGTVFTVNGTLTGTLLDFSTVSGSIVHARDLLRSSGSLLVESSVTFASLTGCSIITTDSSGNLQCGTADMINQTEGDTRYVNVSGDTMTGALNVQANISGSSLSIMAGADSYLMGNVGIGTTSPVQELEVNGDILLGAAAPTLYLGNDSDQYITGNAASNFLTISTANRERLRIDSSGNFGIGTTSPTATLTVSGGIVVNEEGYGYNDVRMEGDTDSALFFLDASTDAIGIGTSTPGTKLDVAGGISGTALKITGVSSFDGAATFGSTVSLGGVTYTFPTSDASSSGRILASDGAGNLSWTADDAGGGSQNVFESFAVSGQSTVVADAITDTLTLAEGSNVTITTNATTDTITIAATDTDTTYSAGQGLALNGTVFTLNGTLSGTLLDFDTFSGTTVHAQDLLTVSGSLVIDEAGSMRGAGLADCDTAGTSKLLWDATTGQFSCGTDTDTDNQSLFQTIAVAGQSNVVADGATDTLTFVGGSNVTITTNAGGDEITFTATDTDTTYSAGQGLTLTSTVFTLGTSLTGATLMSGSTLHADDLLSVSGSLVIDQNGSFYGAGLADCDTAGTSKLLWDATTGQFSCGTDTDTDNQSLFQTIAVAGQSNVVADGATDTLTFVGGSNVTITTNAGGDEITFTATDTDTTYSAGQGLTLTSTVFTLGTSLTGATLMSGSTLHADDLLSVSGSLVIDQNGSFYGAGLADCDNATTSKLLWDATTGQFSCGTDQSGGGGGDPNVDYYVRIAGDTMTGALRIHTGGDASKVAKAPLDVVGLMSGSSLAIRTNIIHETGAVFVDMDGNGTGIFLDSEATNAPGLVIDMAGDSTEVNNAPHILFGYNNVFDVKLYRLPDGNDPGSFVVDTETSGTADAMTVMSSNGGDNNTIFRITGAGNVTADGSFTGGGADYSEWFYSKDDLVQGELVCIDITRANAVERCTDASDGNLMGVVSSPEQAAFVGNAFWGLDGIQPPGYALIGLLGQVATFVSDENGPVRPGDSLTSASKAGYAMRANAGDPTVGVALEGNAEKEGVINVLISRRNSSVTVETMEEHVLETVAAMEIEDEVQLLISGAIEKLSVDDNIATAVESQFGKLDLTSSIADVLASLEKDTGSTLPLDSGRWTAALTFAEGITVEEELKASASVLIEQELRVLGAVTFSGALKAAAGIVTDSLVVSGSALILEDLEVAGAIRTESLEAEGDIVAGGTLHAAAVEASGATLRGDVSIDGKLILNGEEFDPQTMIAANGSSLDIAELTIREALFVLGDVTIEGLAQFLGNVEIGGNLTVSGSLIASGTLVVNDNQAGVAVIPKTGKEVTVAFEPAYTVAPIVTASSDDFASWRIRTQSATGFTIELKTTAENDITFTWHALGNDTPRVVTGPEADELAGIVRFPVDELGYPLSSSDIWNQCIRNRAPLDVTGQPFNCRRYHDEDLWTQPDLLVQFLWDSEGDPRLVVPEGYRIYTVVTEEKEEVTEEKPAEEEETGTGSSKAGSDEQGAGSTGTGSTQSDDGKEEVTGTGSSKAGSDEQGAGSTGTGSTQSDDGKEEVTGTGSTKSGEKEEVTEEEKTKEETTGTGSTANNKEGSLLDTIKGLLE